MKSIFSLIILMFTANAALGAPAGAPADAPAANVLESPLVRVVIDLETGGIAEFSDLSTPHAPLIFNANETVLCAAAGEFRPAGFSVTSSTSNSIVLASPAFQSAGASLPLSTTIRYTLDGCRLSVDYDFEALGRVDLDEGLDINIASSAWDTLVIRNHYSGEGAIAFDTRYTVRHLALNQVYELHGALRNLSLVFPNPYQSLVTVVTPAPHSFTFGWHVLAASPPLQAVEPKGPPLASVLPPGVELHRQIELIVSHTDGASTDLTSPIAYFSPFPNGYDQVIAMTFDDIPFEGWHFPKSSHDSNAPVQQYLIRLLEDHPKMKMGWIILPDGIGSASQVENPNYTPGRWWTAHSIHRVATYAPQDFLQWLRNIDRDSIVYGYENRVHMGSHGYHHTPEMLFGANYEFQSYDPIVNDSTFAAIVREYSLLGLSAKSHRWIRFPGFFFTRATVESLIKYEFVLFDYWGIYDKLPWMLFYSEYGRIWGIGTYWEGDTPSPYDEMDNILRAGKLCHTSGHPNVWFVGATDSRYQQIDTIFQQAEANFPNLGYMWPDQVGFFANETYDIDSIESGTFSDAYIFSFVGSAASGQTVMVEWPDCNSLPTAVTVDGLDAPTVEIRGRRVVIGLPSLSNGPHTVRVSPGPSDSCTNIPPSSVVLQQNYPNPFNLGTVIRYGVPKAAHVRLAIYNVRGERVAVLVDKEQQPGMYTAYWNGRTSDGRSITSGIYFSRLEAGGVTRTNKLVVLR